MPENEVLASSGYCSGDAVPEHEAVLLSTVRAVWRIFRL
jgi:hypothetical protein